MLPLPLQLANKQAQIKSLCIIIYKCIYDKFNMDASAAPDELAHNHTTFILHSTCNFKKISPTT